MKSLKNSTALLISLAVFLSGILNVLSVFISISSARREFVQEFMPLQVFNYSRTATIIVGLFLIFLSKGLAERKNRAWFLSSVLIFVSIILHIVKGLDLEEAFTLFLIFLALVITRGEFMVESSNEKLVKILRNSVILLFALLIYAVLGMFFLNGQFNKPVTFTSVINNYESSVFGIGKEVLIPRTRRARWFNDSLVTVGFGVIVLFFTNLFLPASFSKKKSSDQYKKARELILEYANNPAAYMSLSGDKDFYFSQTQDSFIAYKISGTVAVVLGDPVSIPGKEREIISEFCDVATNKGLTPVFVSTTPDFKDIFSSLGFKSLKIGEDAIIKIHTFSLEGKQSEDVRHSVTRMQKENIIYRWFKLPEIPQDVQIELKKLHLQWIKSKKISALTFSLNFFPLPNEPEAYLLAAFSKENYLLAAFSFYPYKGCGGYSLDLMLRQPNSINGLVEASIAQAVSFFGDIHVDELSLGVAPLADVVPEESRGLLNKTTRFLYKNFNQFYNYKSLFKFKDKFAPSWEPRYLTYKSDAKLISISIGVVNAHLGRGIIPSILKR